MSDSSLLGTCSEPKPLLGPWSYNDIPLQRVCRLEKASMKSRSWVTRNWQVEAHWGQQTVMGCSRLFWPCSGQPPPRPAAGGCSRGVSSRRGHPYLPLLPVTPGGQGLARKIPRQWGLMSFKTHGLRYMWALTTLSKGHSFHHHLPAPSLVDFPIFSPFLPF